MPCPCQHWAWESAQGKPGFLLLPLPPRHVYHNTEGFLPGQWPPSHMGWAACCRPACAPPQPLSSRTVSPRWAAAGRVRPWHSTEPGWAMPRTPARGGRRLRCREVCTASASPHAAPRGTACAGLLPTAPGVRAVSKQWVESRKRRMGNRIWLRRRRQPRPLGPFPFPAPESPSHSRQPRGCTEGMGMPPPGGLGHEAL